MREMERRTDNVLHECLSQSWKSSGRAFGHLHDILVEALEITRIPFRENSFDSQLALYLEFFFERFRAVLGRRLKLKPVEHDTDQDCVKLVKPRIRRLVLGSSHGLGFEQSANRNQEAGKYAHAGGGRFTLPEAGSVHHEELLRLVHGNLEALE